MTMPVECESKEAIVAYLYDEIDAVERNRIEAHLARCSECRAEVNALRAVRIELPAWAPPERDLGFTIADRAQTAAPPRRWIMPAWGLAAAATLVLAAAAAIANLEVSYDADGLTVRTGWGRTVAAPAETRAAMPVVTSQPDWRAELTSLEGRLRDEFAAKEAAPRVSAAARACLAAGAGSSRLRPAASDRSLAHSVRAGSARALGRRRSRNGESPR